MRRGSSPTSTVAPSMALRTARWEWPGGFRGRLDNDDVAGPEDTDAVLVVVELGSCEGSLLLGMDEPRRDDVFDEV